MASKSLLMGIIGRFVLVVILTAVISGLPGLLLVRRELDQQAWLRVEQGVIHTRVLYAARQNELIAFAKLISHRDCLKGVIIQNDEPGILEHLQDLIQGTEINLVAICSPEGKVLGASRELLVQPLCQDVLQNGRNSEKGFSTLTIDNASQIWVTGWHEITNENQSLGWAVAAFPLYDALTESQELSLNMDYTLLFDGIPVASSSPLDKQTLQTIFISSHTTTTNDFTLKQVFDYEGETYYGLRSVLDDPFLEIAVVLNASDVLATQGQLITLLIGTTLIVILLGSFMGIVFARQISLPLLQLKAAAVEYTSGHLEKPVQVESHFQEVTLVAHALDEARSALSNTLTELRQEKAWINHLLESIVEGILTLDENGKITFFSRGAEAITGWKREDVIFSSCDDVFKLVENPSAFSLAIPPTGKQNKIAVELADGHAATLSITRAPLTPSGVVAGETALVFRDVTEEEIIHRRLGNFMGNIAHEFRTPLAALAASIELLMDGTRPIEAHELPELLSSLHLGIFRLQTLIDNLIESASIEAGRFRVTPRANRLEVLLEETRISLQPLFAKYHQTLEVTAPANLPEVWIDGRRTTQVLVNLLANANKFSPADSQVNVCVEQRNGEVWVGVLDEGEGVPPAEKEGLFRRGKRLPGSERANSGAGLGLPVVKAIVEAQGGQVGISDRPNGGSIFWFTVKVA